MSAPECGGRRSMKIGLHIQKLYNSVEFQHVCRLVSYVKIYLWPPNKIMDPTAVNFQFVLSPCLPLPGPCQPPNHSMLTFRLATLGSSYISTYTMEKHTTFELLCAISSFGVFPRFVCAVTPIFIPSHGLDYVKSLWLCHSTHNIQNH